MRVRLIISGLFPLMITVLVPACSTIGDRIAVKRDPFADPSKFENLASNAYSMAVIVEAAERPMTENPLSENKSAENLTAAVTPPIAVEAAPAPLVTPQNDVAHGVRTASSAFAGGSLISSPDVPVGNPLAVRREIASSAPATAVGATAIAPIGSAAPLSPPLVMVGPPAPREAASEVASPDSTFLSLVRGNERFMNGTIRGENRGEARRRALASAENAPAIVLSSSDSRVPPELIFDQGLGEMSVVRVAGGVLGSAQVASIEHSIKHSEAKLIVVLGHEGSSAVKAAVEKSLSGKSRNSESPSESTLESTDEQWLTSSIQANLRGRGIASSTTVDSKFRAPAMANVDAVSEALLLRSKVVSDAVARGKLKIVRGIYGLESGKVDFWGLK
ncbi:MAG: hypothetical protein H7301_15540 [Cryobacterium sp.]|nr:hypothetical protein [Oligoflexia bacterium]